MFCFPPCLCTQRWRGSLPITYIGIGWPRQPASRQQQLEAMVVGGVLGMAVELVGVEVDEGMDMAVDGGLLHETCNDRL